MRDLLIKGKKASAARVISGDSEPEKYAASALAEYLSAAGIKDGDGATFELLIDGSVSKDSYRIEIKTERKINIIGGNGRGVIYGVFGFLEHYAGMRFFMPGLERFGEGDIVVDEDFEHVQVFEMRQSDWPCGNGSVDWCLKNGINQRSIPAEMGGHVKYGGFVHTIGGLTGTPPDKQPCFSDPETLRKTIDGVRKLLESDLDVTIVSVSQNDNQNYCTCEKCRKIDEEEGSHAGSLLRFVNAVAADIAEDYPDIIIDTLAYQHTRKAPKITKPLPNVCIRLCSIECCFCHPLDDESCGSNSAFYHDILEWNKICDRIYIWDYVTNFHFYVPPFPNFDVIRENMRFFATHGVKGMYPEGNYNSERSGEFAELRCYLLARLLNDPLMDAPTYYRHMDEFLEAYYGEGWMYIRAYIDFICGEVKGSHLHIWTHPFVAIPKGKYLAMEDTIDRWWKKALDLAGDRRGAVERSMLQWDCLKIMLRKDEKEAENFKRTISESNIRWNEWVELPRDEQLFEILPDNLN